MSKNRIIHNYRCTQSELYAICVIIWNSFVDQIAVFSSKKIRYSIGYATDMLALISSTRSMPEREARSEVGASLRLELIAAAADCINYWKLLKSYIQDAYDEQVIDLKLGSAGLVHLAGASGKNWEAIHALMTAGHNFISENTAKLSENDMPANFPADYDTSMNAYFRLYESFIMAGITGKDLTQEKQKANNVLYKKTISMCKDGQLYFKDDEAKRQQFVFESVWQTVSSAGSAGLTGEIIDAKTGLGMGAVTLSLYEGTTITGAVKYSTHSEANGEYNFGGIASGTYKMRMEHAGFVTRDVDIEIHVGVSSRKTFMMNE